PPNTPRFVLSTPSCIATSTSNITQPLFISGFTASGKNALDSDTFSVASDKTFITITPSSGLLPPEGTTVTLTISITPLGIGSSEATLTVTRTQRSSKGVLGTTTANVPVSVTLVSS